MLLLNTFLAEAMINSVVLFIILTNPSEYLAVHVSNNKNNSYWRALTSSLTQHIEELWGQKESNHEAEL